MGIIYFIFFRIMTANKKGRNQEPMTMKGSAVVAKELILLVEKIAFLANAALIKQMML